MGTDSKGNPQEPDRDLYNRVIKDFKKTRSVERTAQNCNCARVTAQKILITEGLWSSKTSRAVAELLAQGKTVKEIAAALFITEKTVQTYTPYTRGMYGVATEDAQYSQDYRERMQTAAANMHQKGDEYTVPDERTEADEHADGNIDDISTETDIHNTQEVRIMVAEETYEEREARYKKEFIAKEMKKRFTDDKSWEALNFTDEELDRYEIDPASRWNMKKMDDVTCPPEIQSYHLKLELVPDARWGESLTDYLGGEEDKRRFLKLAKAQQGITRDIVVPGDMNLHALHYAIQQAFGWQNSHLHRYCLPEECFNRLTAGRVGGYMNLCGVLFRCDNEDSDDLYWDDDYEPEMSVKTWIKRKYSRPFRHYAVTDTRYECRRHKLWFRKKHPEITEDMRVSILNSERFGDMFCDDLMEGLTIDDIFGWSGCSDWSNEEAREWMEYIITESFFQDDRFIEEMTAEYEVEHGLYRAGIADKDKAPMDQEIEEEFNSLVDNLKTVRKSRNVIEQEIWKDKQLGGDSGHKYIEEQVGYSAEEALVSYGRHVKYLEGCCEPLFEEYVVHPLPFTDELLYQYDFGDNWWVRITLVGIGDYDVEQAKCIASDGLNLVDDCGGINGFYGFLQSVYGDDPEDKESMKQWARGLGWTGRKKKPENML